MFGSRAATVWLIPSLFVAACADSTPAPAQDGDTDPPPPPQFETTELAPGTYQFRFGGHNTLFVNTDDGVVAFDPISVEAAAAYAEQIREHVPGAELHAIVYSHRDADHASGARVLQESFGADVPIIAHQNAEAPLLQAANPDLPAPDSTFSDQLSLGGGAVELHYLGKSHSDDMAVAFVPEHNLAFAVDFVSSDRFGYQDLSSFHFPETVSAIEGLLAIPFERIIFGHGPAGDRQTIERQLEYYQALTEAVQSAVDAGLSEDETAATILLEEYSDWDRYDDWREMNVRGMHRKLTAEA